MLNISAGTSYNIKLDPFGIYMALRQMHARYPSKPILISENGMPTRNGTRADGVSRSDALTDTVYWVQRARAKGVPVFGYLYWGLTDSYEWGSYTPRFGLYRVDVDKDPTLKRRPTPAVPVFREGRPRPRRGPALPAEDPDGRLGLLDDRGAPERRRGVRAVGRAEGHGLGARARVGLAACRMPRVRTISGRSSPASRDA